MQVAFIPSLKVLYHLHVFLVSSDSFVSLCPKYLGLFLARPQHYLALVSTQVIPAGGSVLAGAGLTLIQLHLTVTARVTHLALAVVGVPHVEAVTRVLAQLVHWDSWNKVKSSEQTHKTRLLPVLVAQPGMDRGRSNKLKSWNLKIKKLLLKLQWIRTKTGLQMKSLLCPLWITGFNTGMKYLYCCITLSLADEYTSELLLLLYKGSMFVPRMSPKSMGAWHLSPLTLNLLVWISWTKMAWHCPSAWATSHVPGHNSLKNQIFYIYIMWSRRWGAMV